MKLEPQLILSVITQITLWALSIMPFLDNITRVSAAFAAVATLIFGIRKFIDDHREKKKRGELLDLQIENEKRQRKIFIKQQEPE